VQKRTSAQKKLKIVAMPEDAAVAVEQLYRSDWARIVATRISLLGDFDLAEEYAQEAFAAALVTVARLWDAESAARLDCAIRAQ
jgi:hypothetical protein